MSKHGGRIITLTGQSGSGKTTQMRELVKMDGFRQSPNITTRTPRDTDLPNEYWYASDEEYGRLLAQPGRLLWDVITGNGAHYSKDICDIIEAFTDPDNIYVHALVPAKARELARRYGSEIVRTVLLPNPGDDILLARMIDRGDTGNGANERLANETREDWLAQSLAIKGLYIATGHTIAEIHAAIVDFAVS